MADILGREHRSSAERVREHPFRLQVDVRKSTSYPASARTGSTDWSPSTSKSYTRRCSARVSRGNRTPRSPHDPNALNEAVRRGHLAEPGAIRQGTETVDEETEPYNIGEVQRLLKVAANAATAPAGSWLWRSASGKEKRSDSNGNTWTSTTG